MTKDSPPPMISLPPQPSFESLFTGGPGFSPGPMTLVSSFFNDHYPDVDCRSFSQLLAGAMASPVSQNLENRGGFKQNRPMELILSQSPSGFSFPSVFSPSGFLNSPLQSPFGMSHQQALAHVTAQAAFSQSYRDNSQYEEVQPQMVNEVGTKSEIEGSEIGSPDEFSVSQSDVTEPQQRVSVYGDANDGYNWRKYGQKQVKVSEHPRSYYKCTFVDCPVRKKVGQSLDGHITDIVYKGQHNHEVPQSNKRAKEGGDVKKPNNSQFQARVVEKQECNNLLIDQGFNQLMRNDEPDDEPIPKRRIIDVGPVDSALSNKAVLEPKIVVQTRSKVDLLDDGFKWRKYGQKVVKGNTNPRSYYKCTFSGCNVRKHVERAPLDPQSVVTSYEGKHNHDIPESRHRGYNNVGGQMGRSTKPSQRKDTKLGNNEVPVLLQMKEEVITA